jgi:hypothetical protein
MVGLVAPSVFEADPIAYVQNVQDNYEELWYFINNWKMNTAEMDEDWNTIYKIGGEYVPGKYEVDVIETTVAEMYSDWTYGDELPESPFVVWACPIDESGMPRIDDLVYSYYFPPVKATIEAVEDGVTTTDVEVEVKVSGATRYYVGLATEEMAYGLPIHDYLPHQEGPFGYFQMMVSMGYADWAFQGLGVEFGGENGLEMPETIKASDIMGGALMPNTKFHM